MERETFLDVLEWVVQFLWVAVLVCGVAGGEMLILWGCWEIGLRPDDVEELA